MKQTAIDLSRNALKVSVHFGTCGGTRRIPKTEKDKMASAIDADADKVPGGINLLPKLWKHRFDRIAGAGRNIVKRCTSPWNDDGMRLLMLSNRDYMLAQLRVVTDEYEKAAKEFAESRDEAFEEAKKEVKNPEIWSTYDFPTPEQIRLGYKWELTEEAIVDTGDVRLSSISQEVLDQIVSSELSRRGKALEAGEKIIAMRADELVHRAYETLVGKDDAKFHGTMIDNASEAIPVLRNMNAATNNVVIESLLDEVQRTLCALDPVQLRKDKAYRATAAAAMENLKRLCIEVCVDVGAIAKPMLERTVSKKEENDDEPAQADHNSGMADVFDDGGATTPAVPQPANEPPKPSGLFDDL